MPISQAEISAGLQYTDHSRWTNARVTYSVPTATSYWGASSYPPGDEPSNPDYGVLDGAQAVDFRLAMEAWARLISLEIVKVDDNATTQGTIRIAFTDTDDYVEGSAAYAYRPPLPGFREVDASGDIWFDADFKNEFSYIGTYFFATMLHEVGHALGLKHPFEEASKLPAEYDNSRYTVMSYTDYTDCRYRYLDVENGQVRAFFYFVEPLSPMLFDVVAIQDLYHDGLKAALDSDTYLFDEFEPFLFTLVDNGGVDVLDLSDHARRSVIDLTPGTFSSIDWYPVADQIATWRNAFPSYDAATLQQQFDRPTTYTWSNNLAIAYDTTIENVRAGSGDDTVTGNAAGNSLVGGAGSDRIFGATGDDTIDGGAAGALGNYLRGDEGNDSLAGGANFDDANGNMGNDTVSTAAGDDYCVGGKDNDLLFGGDDYDLVYGNLGDDTCNGDAGNDIVRGGQGNDLCAGGLGDDFVSGDRGDDTLSGGAGADVFHSFAEAGIDRVTDFSVAEGDRVQLDPGTAFTVSQAGADTVITMSGGQVVLVGVAMSSLPPGTIFGA
jgi:serralysin